MILVPGKIASKAGLSLASAPGSSLPPTSNVLAAEQARRPHVSSRATTSHLAPSSLDPFQPLPRCQRRTCRGIYRTAYPALRVGCRRRGLLYWCLGSDIAIELLKCHCLVVQSQSDNPIRPSPSWAKLVVVPHAVVLNVVV